MVCMDHRNIGEGEIFGKSSFKAIQGLESAKTNLIEFDFGNNLSELINDR